MHLGIMYPMQQPLSKEQATKNLLNTIQQAINSADRTRIPVSYLNNFNPLPQIEQFIKAGADLNAVDAKGNTPLANAIWLEDVRMVQLLLKSKVQVNQLLQHASGVTTALNIAVFRQSMPIVRFLLKAGADPNTGTYVTHTPLETAIIHGDSEIVQMLLNAGANSSRKRPETLRTPLMLAINNEKSDIVEQLIEAGADVNAQDNKGDTALHLAVIKQNMRIITLLIEHEADPSVANVHGQTPLDIARAQKYVELIPLLGTQKIK